MIKVNVTGFGKFQGVESNPTTNLMASLKRHYQLDEGKEPVERDGDGHRVVSATVFETSGSSSRETLLSLLKLGKESCQVLNVSHRFFGLLFLLVHVVSLYGKRGKQG
jgi:hypothetical protein